jgi:ribosomal protein S18 acetylase RimI-like enzyme
MRTPVLRLAQPITAEAHAEALRVLRNECAEWMTRDTSQITPEQQREFFREKIATGKVEGFLLLDGLLDGAEPVAYGLLVWDGQGRAWSSTGIKADRRGRGLGWALTVENVKRAHARGVPIWAEVRADNAPQQKICRAIGYQVTGFFARGGVVIDVMRCDELAPAYA